MENLNTWSDGIEFVLSEISKNATLMSEYHKKRYYYFKGHLKYFRIPTIIFSAMNSVFSVGLQPYCPQSFISLICCFISLICGIISSVELFLSVQATMEVELISSKDFYLLSIDIFKILSLERANRIVNANSYLDEKYQTYCKLIENSNLIHEQIKHELRPLSQLSPQLYLNETTRSAATTLTSSQPTTPLLIEPASENKQNDSEEEDIEMAINEMTANELIVNEVPATNSDNIKINIIGINDSDLDPALEQNNVIVNANPNASITDASQAIKIPRKYVKKNK
jgi:hypothetical protein